MSDCKSEVDYKTVSSNFPETIEEISRAFEDKIGAGGRLEWSEIASDEDGIMLGSAQSAAFRGGDRIEEI